MPTGYTADLYEGAQSFEDFAWGVARGFGALISMRDEPLDAPIPEQLLPSSYHPDRIAQAKRELARLKVATDEQLAEAQENEREEAFAYRESYVREREARRQRYEAMLDQARAYEPPTPDHENFKATMIAQLEQSINFDCGSYEPSVPEELPVAEYRAAKIAEAEREIAYHEKEFAKEVERCEQRTAWVQALRGSLASRQEDAK